MNVEGEGQRRLVPPCFNVLNHNHELPSCGIYLYRTQQCGDLTAVQVLKRRFVARAPSKLHGALF